MSADREPAQPVHVLVLAKALETEPGLLEALRGLAEVRTAETTNEALAALKTGVFDLVLAPPSELFPLARAEARERAELMVERIGQGVCIVDRRGELVWGNALFRSYSDPVQATIRRHCAELSIEFVVGQTPAGLLASRRRTIHVGDDCVFDLTVAPLVVAKHQVEEVVGLALDITATHRLQEKMRVIDEAGKELVRLDAEGIAQLEVADRLKLLEEKTIRFARDLMHFDHFAVRIWDKKTNRLDPLISYGLPEEADRLTIYAAKEGNGISGYVAATGESVICPDVSRDPRYLPGLEAAGSSLTVPLWLQNQAVGILDVEAHELNAFTDDDRQFAEIFSRYVAIALHVLRLLAVERSTTTGQIAADVAAEIAVPLDDIIAKVSRAADSFTGPDDLRQCASAIIANVERVKRSLQELTERPGVRGLVPETSTKDPLISGKRILVAEDEDIIRETIADVLARSGGLTFMARDGQEAISMLRAQRFDLVISDIKMPHHNGYEVFAAGRQANPHCPVILITGFGYDPEHSIVRASKEGLAAVLFKPFKVEQLVEAVRQALAPGK